MLRLLISSQNSCPLFFFTVHFSNELSLSAPLGPHLSVPAVMGCLRTTFPGRQNSSWGCRCWNCESTEFMASIVFLSSITLLISKAHENIWINPNLKNSLLPNNQGRGQSNSHHHRHPHHLIAFFLFLAFYIFFSFSLMYITYSGIIQTIYTFSWNLKHWNEWSCA